MRWLLFGLLISLVALLFVAAAVTRHIYVQHRQLHAKATRVRDPNPSAVLDAEEPDLER